MNRQKMMQMLEQGQAVAWINTHKTDDLTSDDLSDLRAGTARVARLMSDQQWHDAIEICRVAGENGIPASEGLRRLRDLYPRIRRHGFIKEKRRKEGTQRLYEYRFIRDTKCVGF